MTNSAPPPESKSPESKSELDELAQQASDRGLLADYLDYLKATKKWWITPIILALLLVGLLVFLSVSGAGPAIYPFF